MSVIQLTVNCICCKYGNDLQCFGRKLFSVSLVCERRREAIRLPSVRDRSEPTAGSTTSANCGTCSSGQDCGKMYRRNSLNKLSQHICSLRQKYWRFKIPLRAPANETDSQSWLIPKINCDKLKYPQRIEGSKDMTPQSLERKTLQHFTLLFDWLL